MEVVKSQQRGGPLQDPALVMYPRPFGAGERIERYEAFGPRETLGAYVRRVGLTVPSRLLYVTHNGRPVPIALWERLIPRRGDLIVISARALGGGGGGNKVLRVVAQIVVLVASIYTGGVAGGLIAAVGTVAVNALIPLPPPTLPRLSTGEKYESSPTYAIQGGRNRARLWEPMALVFGRHKVVPDAGASPYSEFAGDNQFLCQCFHFGLQGASLKLSDIRIGDTSIDKFQGVQLQRSEEDGKLTMIRGNVDTIQGFTLNNADGWQQRTTAPDTTMIVVDLAARLFNINDDGSMSQLSSYVEIQYRRVGTEGWIPFGTINAEVATHYWSLRDRQSGLQVRYGSTSAAEHVEGEPHVYDQLLAVESFGQAGVGVWRWTTHPYQLGQPWSGIAPNPIINPATEGVRIDGARQEPTRLSAAWEVAKGQYDVRVWKASGDISNNRQSNETAVSQILAVQTDEAEYTGQARVAVRIKATGQLNGSVDELNAVASAMCPVWNGVNWITEETSNPAWWYLWFARGKLDSAGNRLYGGGMVDAQIDIDGIKAWAAWCDEKRLTFNYVLDSRRTAADVLQTIARAGRASPTFQRGTLGVVWDAADVPETAVFGPFNVKAGTFRIEYVNDGTVDEIVGNFVNAETGWVLDEVRAKVPGATTTANPLQLDLDGCTSRDMAGREANLLAAAQVWKRRRISWETDIEGLTCTRGDVVRFSHDLTVWGYSGRLVDGSTRLPDEDGGGAILHLQLGVPSAGSGIAILRSPTGELRTVNVVSEVGEQVDILRVTTDLSDFPLPGDVGYEDVPAFDWVYQFDPLETPGRRFKITSVSPSMDGLRFEATDDDPEYYACEENPYQYTPPRDGALLAGVVLALTGTEQIVSVSTDQIRFSLTWLLSSDAQSLVSIVVNGLPRVSLVTASKMMDIMVASGNTVDVTITPRRGTGSGEPRRQTFVVQGLRAQLPPVTGLTSVFRDGLTVLSWQRVEDVRQPEYEIRLGPTWANARVLGRTSNLEALAVGNGFYHVAAMFRLSDGSVIYGLADTLQITGAALERNVLISINEGPEWDGSLSEGAFVHDGMLSLAPLADVLNASDVLAVEDVLWYGGASPRGTYTISSADRVDVGFIAAVRVGFDIDLDVQNSTDDIFAVADVLSLADVLDGSRLQFVRATPQVRYAEVQGEWTEWRDFVPGLINARFFDVRLILETVDPRFIPFVRQFTWSIDVPDLIQHGEGLAVSPGGVRVQYERVFHGQPNVQITILDAQDGDRAVLSNSQKDGFDIQLINGATPVAREINWLSQGY